MKAKQRLSLGITCVLLTILSIVSLPSGARASDYGVQTTNVLSVGGVGSPQNCYQYTPDFTLVWGQIMESASSSTPFSYQEAWNYWSNYDGGATKLSNFVARFKDSVSSTSGTGWAVSQASEFDSYNTSQSDFKSFHKMIRVWAFDPDTTFTMVAGGLVSNKTVYFTDYFLNPSASCRWQAWHYEEVGTTWLSFSSNKFLFVNADSITYPGDYDGDPIPSAYSPPTATYVAMGDSFSSGEGNPSFEDGTDQNDVNECHRSPKAYPRLLQNSSALDIGPTAFVACSGAATADVLWGGTSDGSWGEDPQVDAVSSDTERVTITVGGNDVGFRQYAEVCVVAYCGPVLGTVIYDAIMANIEDSAFSDNLKDVYERILTDAENADVYVLDYPYLFDPSGEDGYGCTVADGSGAGLVQQALNAVIATAVADVRAESPDFDERLNYVDTNATGSPFSGKHLCTDDPAGSSFNGVFLFPVPDEYSLHPNSKGQNEYYTLMEDLLN